MTKRLVSSWIVYLVISNRCANLVRWYLLDARTCKIICIADAIDEIESIVCEIFFILSYNRQLQSIQMQYNVLKNKKKKIFSLPYFFFFLLYLKLQGQEGQVRVRDCFFSLYSALFLPHVEYTLSNDNHAAENWSSSMDARKRLLFFLLFFPLFSKSSLCKTFELIIPTRAHESSSYCVISIELKNVRGKLKNWTAL